MLNDKWFVNGSVRWIDTDTEVTFNLGGDAGSVDSIEIDPWVYTVTLGYRFQNTDQKIFQTLCSHDADITHMDKCYRDQNEWFRRLNIDF